MHEDRVGEMYVVKTTAVAVVLLLLMLLLQSQEVDWNASLAREVLRPAVVLAAECWVRFYRGQTEMDESCNGRKDERKLIGTASKGLKSCTFEIIASIKFESGNITAIVQWLNTNFRR